MIFVILGKLNEQCNAIFQAQASVLTGRAHRWWDKHLVPNMEEITSASELIDAISSAGDKLVVVDFFSPGCGGCKALHPKVHQSDHVTIFASRS